MKSCFSCGEEKPYRHMRLLNNVALQSTYLALVKEVLLVEMPPDGRYKLCEPCIQFMQKVASWRQAAIVRLEESSSTKIPLSATNTPSPVCKKVVCDKENVTPPSAHDKDHDYARCSEDVDTVTCQTSKFGRGSHARGYLSSQMHTSMEDVDFMRTVKEDCHTLADLSSAVLSYGPSRKDIKDALLREMNTQMQSLCTLNDLGTVLTMNMNDPRTHRIAQVAIEECRRRVPLLYDTLVIASTSSASRQQEWHIFAIYAILMRCRSQRQNILQRLLTAACIRHHAGNELLTLLSQFQLTIAAHSKLHFLESVAQRGNGRLVTLLRNSRGCKITCDNIDWRMVANQVRLSSGNKDCHYAHWTVMPDRFSPEELEQQNHQVLQISIALKMKILL